MFMVVQIVTTGYLLYHTFFLWCNLKLVLTGICLLRNCTSSSLEAHLNSSFKINLCCYFHDNCCSEPRDFGFSVLRQNSLLFDGYLSPGFVHLNQNFFQKCVLCKNSSMWCSIRNSLWSSQLGKSPCHRDPQHTFVYEKFWASPTHCLLRFPSELSFWRISTSVLWNVCSGRCCSGL